MKLTLNDKSTIDNLTSQGNKAIEISRIMGIKYQNVYNYIYRTERRLNEKYRQSLKPKAVKKSTFGKFVDTGRPLSINPPKPLNIIIDPELAELACKQMGLSKPVCSLSERPSSYNANGWVRIGAKWVAGQPATNDGMLKSQPKMFMTGKRKIKL